MIVAIAQGVVVLAGLYLVGLGVLALAKPGIAGRFLQGFAGSAPKHYAELAVRFLVGAALLVHAPRMAGPAAFRVFGWLLLATTAALLCVPWRWHDRFARAAVPRAMRHARLVGLFALLSGAAVLAAMLFPGTGPPT